MITEQVLIEAAAEFNLAFLNSLPDETSCNHIFSKQFERKIKRLIHKADHPVLYKVMQRAASFVLVLFISFMAILAISPTVRAAVFGWVKEQYNFFVEYTYTSKSNTYLETNNYYLAYVPNCYRIYQKYETPGNSGIIYINDQNQLLCFAYSKNPEQIKFFLDMENHVYKKLEINNQHIDYYISNNSTTSNGIYWHNIKDETFFYISTYENESEIIKMFKNLKKVKN